MNHRLLALFLASAVLWSAASVSALDPGPKCEAAKNKIAGKYAFCRQKAEAKAIKTGVPADYSKCDSKFTGKWATAETNGGGACPSTGDQTGIQNQITADSNLIALKLTGVRFVDNGDGTVTDVQTGLMWEKKDNLDGSANLGDPHDADNLYSWSSSGTAADGTALTDFLSTLNDCESSDGSAVTGGFAGHCDWRLPTNPELQTIVDPTATGCGTGNPCIFSALGPTVAGLYWSSTTDSGSPSDAWFVHFGDGSVNFDTKADFNFVRAVRGGS